jgi:RNA polymerase sigma factor for flagellar operon FliA
MKTAVARRCPESLPSAAVWRPCDGVPSGVIDEKDMIERYLPLVRSVVDRIKLTLPSHIDADDLNSVGITGLMAAVGRFDPNQGSTFASYAATRIRGAILDELRRMDWCPRRARARARKLKEAVNAIEQRLGRAATEAEICKELGLEPREYAKWIEASRPVTFIAIDHAVEDDDPDGASLHELLADPSDRTGPEKMEKKELIQIMTQRIAELPDIPRKILAMYYFENMRLVEIAQVFGLTESRICQIHSQTILGLRAFISRARNR